jgi:hypothetical protein
MAAHGEAAIGVGDASYTMSDAGPDNSLVYSPRTFGLAPLEHLSYTSCTTSQLGGVAGGGGETVNEHAQLEAAADAAERMAELSADGENEDEDEARRRPVVELLDAAPAAIDRPLALVNGRAYAATWPVVRLRWVKDDDAEEDVTTAGSRQLVIVRDDGLLFGDGLEPLDELRADVRLPEAPPLDKLWSAAGVRRYQQGARPDPAAVFTRVADVVDRFIDFEQSLAPQRAMSELIACYILATWFLDAFNVIGFLWPSGDRGSGKTKLLTIVSELSYLGQMILAGGSYATLRDLADYGATLAFDDAEALGDPKRGDANKRNLLLAGNRRGSRVTVKEMSSEGRWQVRYVNTYCPRLFSATRLPDPILASRTIVVPLVRTPDRGRANAEPLDESAWPHERGALLDDLWALALAHLAELPAYERRLAAEGPLTGRGLERWRAVLAVARWLGERGVTGLAARMDRVALVHYAEQTTLETGDLTTVPVEQLRSMGMVLATSEVAEAVEALADENSAEIDERQITAQRIGHVLRKLRFKQSRSAQQRGWEIRLGQVLRCCQSYGVEVPMGLVAVKERLAP